MPYRVVDLINECKHVGDTPPFIDTFPTIVGRYALGAELDKAGLRFGPEAVAQFQQAIEAAVRDLVNAPVSIERVLKGQNFADVEAKANRFARPTLATFQLVEAAVVSMERHAVVKIKSSRRSYQKTALKRHQRRVSVMLELLTSRRRGGGTVKDLGLAILQRWNEVAASSQSASSSGDAPTTMSAYGAHGSNTLDLTKTDDDSDESDAVERAVATFISYYHARLELDAAYNIVPHDHRAYNGSGATIYELRDLIQTVMPSELSEENARTQFSQTGVGSDFDPDKEIMLLDEALRDVRCWEVIDAPITPDPPASPEPEDRSRLYRAREILKEMTQRIAQDRTEPRSAMFLGPAGIGKSYWLRSNITEICYSDDTTVRPYFINFKSVGDLPPERVFEISALDRVLELSLEETKGNYRCWAFIDECTQLAESDYIRLKHMVGFCMAGDERQSYAALRPGMYETFVKNMGGQVIRDGVSWRAENHKLTSLMMYLFYGGVQPPVGIDSEKSMVQLHFCGTDDRRVIAQRMYAHALKHGRSTILCDDLGMRSVIKAMIVTNTNKGNHLKIISSKELFGHECWSLIVWADEHDKPNIGLNEALIKINLMLGRAAFRLSILCSGARRADRDHLLSTMLLAAVSHTPSRAAILEDKKYAAFDEWLFKRTGHRVATQLGHIVFMKDDKVVCSVVPHNSDIDMRALTAAERLKHRRIVRAPSALFKDFQSEETWLQLTRQAGLIVETIALRAGGDH